MAGRKIEDENEAIDALDSVARTGLDLKDWCRARDIDARSLAGWRGVLEARGYAPPEERDHPDFIEVLRVPVERQASYTVRHGAFSIELDHTFDDRTLGRLLRVLAAVLAGSLAAWRVYLHPDQRKLVTMKANGPVRVLGGAGTGKTVALLHRAKYLVQSVFGEADERLLVTSFTRNLPQDLRAQMSQLVDREALRRMDFVHLHGYASELWKAHGDGRPVVYDVDAHWAEAMAHDDLQLGEAFYRAEWEQIVQDQGIRDEVGYMRCRRPGRGSPLPRSRRKLVWRVFEAYRSALVQRDGIEAADQFELLADKLASGAIPREYVSLLCDEVQDFGSPELRFMRALVEPAPHDLFFVGDTHQRIYGHEVAMGRCGIAIQGRARRLRVNYRTTARVRQFAVGALTGLSFDDMDGGEQDLKGYRSVRVGLEPQITLVKSKAAEQKAVVALVRGWLDEVAAETVCVAAPTKSVVAGMKRALSDAGIVTMVIQGGVSDEGSGVRLATFARMKGLEFQRVLLAGVNEGQVPLRPSAWYTMDEDGKALFDRQQRCLLYVAATRARDVLAVTGHGRVSPFLAADEAEDDVVAEAAEVKRCPRCGVEGPVEELFGYRQCHRRRKDGTKVVVRAAQSYCRACR